VPPPRKGQQKEESSERPTSPQSFKETIYETLPRSLKSELVVRSREMVDPMELEVRREAIRTQTPAQLSEIRGLTDLPVPTFIENLVAKKDTAENNTQ
jgi:hypothetical protein